MFLDLPWKTGDSSEQIVVQEYFTAALKDIGQTKTNNNFISIRVTKYKMNEHKMNIK